MDIQSYDHVGIRVSDRARALSFYRSLGFEVDEQHSHERVAEIVNAHGVRIALIFNGTPYAGQKNILMDVDQKWPGYTHAAFIVPRLTELLDWAKKNDVVITEGPVNWERRLTCFFRDPDGNVLEFNELLKEEGARDE